MNDVEEKLKPLFESKQYWKAKQVLRRMIKNSNKYNPGGIQHQCFFKHFNAFLVFS
jgi:hypothetical protein